MKKVFPVLQYVNLPNLLTSLGLCFGLTACYYLIGDRFNLVLICLFFSMLMDLMDGFAAVKLNRRTGFGIYADTLADFFICCIMPVLIAFTFLESSAAVMLGAGFYCICGMWRLAHYNVTVSEQQTHYTGLPVPGAMLFVTMAIWCAVNFGLPAPLLCVPVFIAAGLLMVSSLKLRKYGYWQIALCAVGLAFLLYIIYRQFLQS